MKNPFLFVILVVILASAVTAAILNFATLGLPSSGYQAPPPPSPTITCASQGGTCISNTEQCDYPASSRYDCAADQICCKSPPIIRGRCGRTADGNPVCGSRYSGSVCRDASSCVGTTHKACVQSGRSWVCSSVPGAGADLCDDADPTRKCGGTNPKHSVCQKIGGVKTCIEISGGGDNQCTKNADCSWLQ